MLFKDWNLLSDTNLEKSSKCHLKLLLPLNKNTYIAELKKKKKKDSKRIRKHLFPDISTSNQVNWSNWRVQFYWKSLQVFCYLDMDTSFSLKCVANPNCACHMMLSSNKNVEFFSTLPVSLEKSFWTPLAHINYCMHLCVCLRRPVGRHRRTVVENWALELDCGFPIRSVLHRCLAWASYYSSVPAFSSV